MEDMLHVWDGPPPPLRTLLFADVAGVGVPFPSRWANRFSLLSWMILSLSPFLGSYPSPNLSSAEGSSTGANIRCKFLPLAFLIWAVQHKSCYHLRSFRHLCSGTLRNRISIQNLEWLEGSLNSFFSGFNIRECSRFSDKQSFFFTVTTWPSTAYLTLWCGEDKTGQHQTCESKAFQAAYYKPGHESILWPYIPQWKQTGWNPSYSILRLD